MSIFKKILLGIALLLLVVVLYSLFQTPSNDRNWAEDQKLLPSAVFEGDTVIVKNVRNFEYKSETDYIPSYYDVTVKLSDLESVDYIVEPLGSIGVAHTLLSFGFKDGKQIAISVEIRKEKGESFSPFVGVLRGYEIMYVVADESDVIKLRTNHRKDVVYIYPTVASPEAAQDLFVKMLTKANELEENPEFYNTLTNNCATNIANYIDEVSGDNEKIGLDYRLILPEFSDILAKEFGFILSDMSIEEGREKYRINERAEMFKDSEDFSRQIREYVPPDENVVSQVSKKEVSSETSFLNTDEIVSDLYFVTRVIDGDTIEVEIDGEKKRVRYLGVDTPETAHSSKPVQCFGREASEYNKKLVEGKWVRLEKDISETDKYGRLLRYVYVGDRFVNFELISRGYANVVTYPPDVKHIEKFLIAERIALAEKRGLWGAGCERESNVVFSPTVPVKNSGGESEGCLIKGNINKDKEKIYHVPSCEYYDKTIVSENYGERWFCTEDEALEAGWRKALNCL